MATTTAPAGSPAPASDAYIAGKTTEAVIRDMVAAQVMLGETVDPILAALVRRFDRKAERRAAKAEAAAE